MSLKYGSAVVPGNKFFREEIFLTPDPPKYLIEWTLSGSTGPKCFMAYPKLVELESTQAVQTKMSRGIVFHGKVFHDIGNMGHRCRRPLLQS